MTFASAAWASSSASAAPGALRTHTESPLFTLALALFTVLVLTVSPLALGALGFDYTDTGGNVLTKFHPATLYLCFLFVLAAAATGDPLGAIVQGFRTTPSSLLLVGATLIAVVHAAMISKLPFTPLIETFIPAPLLLILLTGLKERRGRMLAGLIHTILFANAVLALGEYLTGWRLTPFVIDGESLDYEWRATALLGHPLANAMITGTYIILLAVGGGRDLPWLLRAVSFTTCLAAMTAFGGRGALVLVLAVLALLAARKALSVLNGAALDTRAMMASILAVPIAGAGVLYLTHTGFFDLLISRFVDDTGSAQTRLDMTQLFSHIPLQELLFGPDPRVLTTWQDMLGLQRGIESFWISMTLSYGLLVAGLVFLGLLAHCWTVARRCRPGAAWALVYFIAVASTSLSLAGKSSVLTIATLLPLVLLRRPPVMRPNAPLTYRTRLR